VGRRFVAVLLLVLALLLLIAVPLTFFTPLGGRVFPFLSPSPPPIPRPILTVRGTPPPITASAAYLLDADTGNTLVNIHGDQRLPMASTTKIMTAIITLEKGDLNQLVTVPQAAADEVKKNLGSSAQLVPGDKIRVLDLLYGLMLPSGDDAAIALADAVAGGSPQFVALMNQYAQHLHLMQTHYINPDGLTYKTASGNPDPDHYSSAADLVQLTRYALRNPLFAQIVQLQRFDLPATSDHHAYTWLTTDDLLRFYPGATGVKTGFTEEAGYCLVFSATNSGHHLIGALLQDKDNDHRLADARALLDWSFALPLLPPPPLKQSS
jgi:D-alanyl-D-alanine carboxypeptidase (penicillin-binding protein 5/6)